MIMNFKIVLQNVEMVLLMGKNNVMILTLMILMDAIINVKLNLDICLIK